jgi:cell volume regulation protein A
VDEVVAFGEIVLVVAGGLLAAIALRAVAERIALPSAALFLAVAAVASDVFPSLGNALSFKEVERIAVVALVVILFDGGLRIGWRRFRASAVPILSLGVLGTFATAGLVAVGAHWLLDMSWTTAGLLGAAIAPTDPAVVFSVLGNREIRGRAGTILEGESGANDPVGIALMIGMIELATTDDGSMWGVAREFAVEMTVGLAVGIAGWRLLLPLLRRVALPEPALHPLRLLAAAGVIYGAAAALHGSGFIAVFAAGVLLGDEAMPRKREVGAFLSALSSLAEITVFVALGLTIEVSSLDDGGVWLDGLVIAAVLGFVVRPLVVTLLLTPIRLRWGERLFVTWSGLKGAVPILLAALAVLGEVDEAQRLYGIVFVVVLFSVVLQGTLVPFAASRLGVPMRRIEHDASGVRRFVVREGAFAAGAAVGRLPLGERASLALVARDGRPLPLGSDTVLEPGDEVHVWSEPGDVAALQRIFEGPGPYSSSYR